MNFVLANLRKQAHFSVLVEEVTALTFPVMPFLNQVIASAHDCNCQEDGPVSVRKRAPKHLDEVFWGLQCEQILGFWTPIKESAKRGPPATGSSCNRAAPCGFTHSCRWKEEVLLQLSLELFHSWKRKKWISSTIITVAQADSLILHSRTMMQIIVELTSGEMLNICGPRSSWFLGVLLLYLDFEEFLQFFLTNMRMVDRYGNILGGDKINVRAHFSSLC